METQKKRRGDRKDGRLMRELDSLHYVTGILYPNRCDNEAYISQRIDQRPLVSGGSFAHFSSCWEKCAAGGKEETLGNLCRRRQK